MKSQIHRTLLTMLLSGAVAVAMQLAPDPPIAQPAPPAPAAAPTPRAVVASPAFWQVAPTPPAPPAQPAAPSPAPLPSADIAPVAPVPPMPPVAADWGQYADQLTLEQQERIDEAAQRASERAMEAQERALEAQQRALEKADQGFGDMKPFNFNFDFDIKGPLLAAQNALARVKVGRMGNTDGLYDRGRRELDQHNWDQALADFTEVASRAGNRADGALYWKAYALNKLGRRDEALAAIAELRKSYAGSRWLDDAAALEVEVKQSAGGTVAPDSQNDDEIKLLALNGLMQSDPDRAYPYLEKILKSAGSPHLKEQTIFVLAQSNSPKAQQALVQIAKGGSNPDLQLTAIRYLSAVNRRQGNNNQTLFEIYNSSNDPAVKREILNALSASKDRDHLLEIARNEKNHDMQLEAIRRLGSWNSQPSAGDALVGLYNSSQDKDVKHEIVNMLAGQRNAKALVELGRNEKDIEQKKFIVERVMGMNTPESKQFLEEILK